MKNTDDASTPRTWVGWVGRALLKKNKVLASFFMGCAQGKRQSNTKMASQENTQSSVGHLCFAGVVLPLSDNTGRPPKLPQIPCDCKHVCLCLSLACSMNKFYTFSFECNLKTPSYFGARDEKRNLSYENIFECFERKRFLGPSNIRIHGSCSSA